MIRIDKNLQATDLEKDIRQFWELSGCKINLISEHYDESQGSPVFTREGNYTSRGWTEWTQGFQYGSSILQFDATGDSVFLDKVKVKIVSNMATHVSHIGVHDHGFNNISTYGNLLRLLKEGKIPQNEWEKNFYELALKISGAVQASRWTNIKNGGFIHSFNGEHSLFVDTIRSCRSLIIAHLLGHELKAENDIRISLLERTRQHIVSTATYSVYYGEGRDAYDLRGRTAHEIIFNPRDGNFRCPNSQQGYSGFSTWTRGLAWAICGFAELFEWIQNSDESVFSMPAAKSELKKIILKAATATSDYFIESTPSDGVPYWDTGAPWLFKLGDYLNKPADPFNEFEPVDSSAAAIAAQGLLRLGKSINANGDLVSGELYWQAGLKIVQTLLQDPYLSRKPKHQGILLHSVYHKPNGWDYIPKGSKIPYGESSMWGDYHVREVCLYLQRIIENKSYYTFYNCVL